MVVTRAESDQFGDDDNSKVITLYFLLLKSVTLEKKQVDIDREKEIEESNFFTLIKKSA